MIDYVMNFKFNSTLGLLMYWVPLALCSYGYLIRCFYDFNKDKENCQEKYYRPELTIGAIIGRALVSIIPVANLMAAVFDVAPEVFSRFFRWIAKVFDQPLVRHKYVSKE